MKQLLVFPTWLFFLAFKRVLPRTHEWRGKTRTLRQWAEGSTALNDNFSWLLWAGLLELIALGIYIWARSH
jgi:hypothetical protein